MINEDARQRTNIVIGHTNPDTDSICSAIAYAELKNRMENADERRYEAFRTGELNRETAFVLQRFGAETPRLCHDVYAEVQDIDIRPVDGVPPDTSMRRAWELMRDLEAKTQPVIAEDVTLLGICTLGDTEFGVGQSSYMSPENLEKAKELLQSHIREAREKTDLDMIFYLLTDIRRESSYLIYDGENAQELVEEAFETDTADGSVFLEGVISRKKQLIPPIVNTLRKM